MLTTAYTHCLQSSALSLATAMPASRQRAKRLSICSSSDCCCDCDLTAAAAAGGGGDAIDSDRRMSDDAVIPFGSGGSNSSCDLSDYYLELASRISDRLRQAADAGEDEAIVCARLQESLQMRLPKPKSDRASDFIPQSELIPLDPSFDSYANQQLSLIEPQNNNNEENNECSSHDLSPELIEKSQSLLLDQFHDWHRCCHVFHVMAYHPAYLEVFLRFHNTLLQGSGPIGVAERHYLAIMAAARHKCSYLVQLHALEFIHVNGDAEWLRGIEHAPAKIQKLGCLCRLLAHRPWEVSSSILRSLLSGPDSYSQSELVHAMCLLSHFIALAGFVAGTGVCPEIDFPQGYRYRSDSGEQRFCSSGTANNNNSSSSSNNNNNNNKANCSANNANSNVNGTQSIPVGSPAPSSPGIDPQQRVLDLMNVIRDLDNSADECLAEDQRLQRFENVELENADIRFVGNAADQAAAELANFCEDADYDYKDFHQAKSDSKSRSFRIQDYSWEEDGSCLTDRFLPSFGSELDQRFLSSFNLTYGTMGVNENVETAPFRRAVWYYVHSIFGLRHDDYDYNFINRLLNIELKKYCKLVACCPHQVTKSHYKAAMPGFKHSEKVHVNLVIMDSRLQASMLYGLRALNNYMTEQ